LVLSPERAEELGEVVREEFGFLAGGEVSARGMRVYLVMLYVRSARLRGGCERSAGNRARAVGTLTHSTRLVSR
jgi:hypothetical protein